MDAAPRCVVCAEQGGKHCTKCKSRHYCSKQCQVLDWHGGHKQDCRRLAALYQDRLLEEMGPPIRLDQMPKEAPAIAEDAEGVAQPRPRAVSADRTHVVKAKALRDAETDWRGTCAICLDLLPLGDRTQRFYACCCKKICKECAGKCWQHDERCPLCRTPARTSDAEWVRRVQKHVDKGNAEAQAALGDAYRDGDMGLSKKSEKAVELYTSAARQGHPGGQNALGHCYEHGQGTKVRLDA
jgi:TPR repeat protein